jgi:mannan endo-1,4-beta-mannosidase
MYALHHVSNRKYKVLLVGFMAVFWLSPNVSLAQKDSLMAEQFISVRNNQFIRNGKPYYFLGANFWYGMNLGMEGREDLRDRLSRELDHLKSLGIDNLRIMAGSEGPDDAPWRMTPTLQKAPGEYNDHLLKGLDFLLSAMQKRDMVAVVCLNNFWPWSGGFAQYVNWTTGDSIPYPPPAKNGRWLKFMQYSGRFYKNQAAQEAFREHIRVLINRTNTISGVAYKNDPTILSWQLANEPRAIPTYSAYLRWVEHTAAFIKELDSNHLVSVGSDGNVIVPFSKKFDKEHQIKNIDYATFHLWIQNWGWYNPKKADSTYKKAVKKAKQYIRRHNRLARRFNMPVVLEEFGIARDNELYHDNTPTSFRNDFYEEVFELVHKFASKGAPMAGSNFWAWAGEGRPDKKNVFWQAGDDFTGDPPFEPQGWYSVYNTDETTLSIIKAYAEKMQMLKND